jgi:Flp pilus assembly protein TadG
MRKFRFGDNRGSAIVELALTTPLFTLLILGAAELGRVAYYGIEVESAARAGASYGSVNISNATNYQSNVKQAALNDAPDLPNMTATAGTACVCETYTYATGTQSYSPSSGTVSCTSTTSSSCTEDDSTAIQTNITYVTVSTSVALDPLIHVPGLPNTYNLSGYSELRTLQN